MEDDLVAETICLEVAGRETWRPGCYAVWFGQLLYTQINAKGQKLVFECDHFL